MVWLCILIVLLGVGCGETRAIDADPVAARVCDRDSPHREPQGRSLACPHASGATSTAKAGFVSLKRGMLAAIISLVPRRKTNTKLIVSALAAVAMLAAAPAADAVERTATPATLASVFASAGGGDTILLASGDYGTFHGAIKGGLVTLTPQPGATVSMDIDFNPASNIAIDGVTITDAFITGTATKSITIRNSDFPGQIWLDTRELHDSDVTLANDVFHDWNTCASCGEARVFLTGGSQPSGVTIRDSKFYGGLSDGIQNGSYGTKIIGNEFHDITPGSPEGVHADAIQLYGSSHTVIRANYMHDMPEVPFIMAADGTDHELIEDNVVEGSSHGYPYITLFSDDSSIIRHNTFADGSCAFNLPCGILRLGAKDSDDPGHGTVVKDNILSEISTEGSTTIAERSHNLLAHDGATSPGDLPGKPTYARGPDPRQLRRLPPGAALPRQEQRQRRDRSRSADREGRRAPARQRPMPAGEAKGQEGEEEAATGRSARCTGPTVTSRLGRRRRSCIGRRSSCTGRRRQSTAPVDGGAGRASGRGVPRGRDRCEYARTAGRREPIAAWGGDRSSRVRRGSCGGDRSGRRARPRYTRAQRARPRRRSP